MPSKPRVKSIPIDEFALGEIHRRLQEASGIDFRMFKRAAFKKKLDERIRLGKLQTSMQYASSLRTDDAEVCALTRDLLRGNVSFFPSPRAMSYLKQTVLPLLLGAKLPGETIRVWVPACSSGQEAYSVAIQLMQMQAIGRRPIQIFATDLDKNMLGKARSGCYTHREVAGVSAKRLTTFFDHTENGYRVNMSVRNLCIFSTHNVFRDLPFSHIDLIVCTNLMNRLEDGPQKKIASTFHFALARGGLLVLGGPESTAGCQDLFKNYSRKFSIYVKVDNASSGAALRSNYELAEARLQASPAAKEKSAQQVVDEILVRSFAPACVVVDKNLNITQFRGNAGLFIDHPAGRASLNLLKIARKGLGLELKIAVHQASCGKERYRHDEIEVDAAAGKTKVSIDVVPLPPGPTGETFLIVLQESVLQAESPGSPNRKDRNIRELKTQLSQAREAMRLILEEQQGMNEELQSANQEVVSCNQELASINQSLVTSKEEADLTIEQFITVNDQLRLRNKELADALEYAESVTSAMEEAVVLLSMDYEVRMANRSFYDMFSLAAADVMGKKIFAIHKGKWLVPGLEASLKHTLSAGKRRGLPEQRINIRGSGGRSFVFRIKNSKKGKLGEELILLTIGEVTKEETTGKTP